MLNYNEMYSRNNGFFSQDEQSKLKKATVAIAGVGGVGGIQAALIARLGVGKIILADPDNFDITDLNRQYGANKNTIGLNKATVMKGILKDHNPYCDIKIIDEGITMDSIDSFLDQVDVVVDAIEFFCIKEKVELHKKARNNGIPVVTSPIPGYGASMTVFTPDSMTFEDFIGYEEELSDSEMNNRFLKTIFPVIPQGIDHKIYKRAIIGQNPIPSLSASTGVSGGLVSAEVAILLTCKRPSILAPKSTYIDLYSQKFHVVDGGFKNNEKRRIWDEFAISGAYDSFKNVDLYNEMIYKAANKFDNKDSVLDLGCGTGNLTIELCRNHIDVWSIDSSKNMLIELENKLMKEDDSVRNFSKMIINGSAYNTNFPSESFTGIALLNVLFNLDNPKKAINEVFRLLKPGGTFVLSGPIKKEGNLDLKKVCDEFVRQGIINKEKIKNSEELINKAHQFNFEMYNKGFMNYIPCYYEIETLLTSCGFKIDIYEDLYVVDNIAHSFLITATKVKCNNFNKEILNELNVINN